jgi:hypothetical protein
MLKADPNGTPGTSGDQITLGNYVHSNQHIKVIIIFEIAA